MIKSSFNWCTDEAVFRVVGGLFICSHPSEHARGIGETSPGHWETSLQFLSCVEGWFLRNVNQIENLCFFTKYVCIFKSSFYWCTEDVAVFRVVGGLFICSHPSERPRGIGKRLCNTCHVERGDFKKCEPNSESMSRSRECNRRGLSRTYLHSFLFYFPLLVRSPWSGNCGGEEFGAATSLLL